MCLIAKVIRISDAKFHCNRLTTVQDIQDYASLIFGTQYITPSHHKNYENYSYTFQIMEIMEGNLQMRKAGCVCKFYTNLKKNNVMRSMTYLPRRADRQTDRYRTLCRYRAPFSTSKYYVPCPLRGQVRRVIGLSGGLLILMCSFSFFLF